MTNAGTSYDLTAKARERYAAKLFNVRTIEAAIKLRAGEGYRHLRLSQEHPFDLSDTISASQLEAWLEDRYAWYPTPPLLDPLYSASSEDYPELAIFW